MSVEASQTKKLKRTEQSPRPFQQRLDSICQLQNNTPAGIEIKAFSFPLFLSPSLPLSLMHTGRSWEKREHQANHHLAPSPLSHAVAPNSAALSCFQQAAKHSPSPPTEIPHEQA